MAHQSFAINNTTTTLVTAAPGTFIRVTGFGYGNATAGTFGFSGDNYSITGQMPIADKATFASGDNPRGWFGTEFGGTLKGVAATGTVTGWVTYDIIGQAQTNADGTAATSIAGMFDFASSLETFTYALI